ncbi:hypothetical protein B0J13DRAFT_231754 [Dactylonectria estremocensis]|uniref:Structure-specific endonuclease subunit SLX4 n=1 Tax=Dactylonectria estremocensis TaxID=1079267 RepID=A0A9P9F8C3_9HYPO|nr:hypothetical protein B0J13DRAFT_231754 [Dactylonectria estremocensis]
MASSDVFRSSPPPATQRKRLVIGSSSPDLPPLQQFLSRKLPRPPLRSGNRAAPIPDDAPRSFVSARNLLQFTETALETPPAKTINPPVIEQPCEADVSILIIETPQQPQPKPKPKPKTKPRPRNPRAKKLTAETAGVTNGPNSDSKPTVKERVRKKPQRKAKNDEHQDINMETQNKSEGSKESGSKGANTANLRSESIVGSLSANAKATSTDEPLDLEFATARKVDWTPPSRKTVINIDSDCSTVKKLAPNSESNQTPTFKNLLKGYACIDTTPQAASAPQDEDSGFLKKRKRIELVKDANPREPEIPPKSPTKRKAPRKKPRTITELATAAYKTPTQLDVVPPSTSVADHFPPIDADPVAVSNDSAKKGKSKSSSRKRPSRAVKKKAAPPKPILLSPGAALDQVAKQNFLFGTSSQLAREPSPTTVLRGVQSVLGRPNQDDFDGFITPINSDAIEPPEQRPRLWDAAARDAEGDLFDIEVVNLIESSPQLPRANPISDPFGYFRNGSQSGVAPATGAAVSESANSFINLSDILPSPGKMPAQAQDGQYPFFSGSDASASNKTQGQTKPGNPPNASANQPSGSQEEPGFVNQSPRPKYELLTDVQLAKEIKTYGFKPIKRRSAMLSLLDQCWQSKVRVGQAGIHTSTASSTAASKPTKTNDIATAESPGKRPRGRPRKNSVSASEPQEPPPSAQPPDTPKRPRGRPRKNSASPSPVAKSRSKPKLKSPKRGAVSPGRKKTERKAVIEIPDSASDNGSNFASSPDSSVGQMFSSPPPLDLSLSVAGETHLSLSASPNDQQVALFDHITRAVRSTPRATDPVNPSWHEKILLYDPIVLEDLAAWLNSGELTRIGFDGEISPGEVKKWCESKSICCLSKVNLRGKERKRL